MGRIIGIDLGTTNSLAAYWKDGKSVLIPNSFGEYLTPSVVSIDDTGTILVGKMAKERLITDPEHTVCEFKRGMGTARRYTIGDKRYAPEELSAMVLKAIKEDAEKYLNDTVEEAIISVPAYFSDKARKATRRAGLIAGLKVDRIINEPSAAALAYRYTHNNEDGKYLVFDFGGGTLDVSLVECFENIVEIVAVSGDNRLGGLDFNYVLAQKFCATQGIIFEEQDIAMQQIILRSAERAKRFLTVQDNVSMTVDSDNIHGSMMVTRRNLIQMSMKLMDKAGRPVKTVLRDAKISSKQIAGVVLVGGSCKMPIIQDYLKFLLKLDRIKTVNPDYMVALGVGLCAGIKEKDGSIQDMILTDLCPFSLGTQVMNFTETSNPYMSVIIPRNCPLPTSRTHIYTTAYDNVTSMKCGIYQGEDMYVKNNLKLAELEVTGIPKAPAKKEKIQLRFTYDINGLLFVDAKILSTEEEKHLMLGAEGESAELNEQIAKLEKLRFDTKESQENKLLLERAKRIYRQLSDESYRQLLIDHITAFEQALNYNSHITIRKERVAFESFLNDLENEAQFDISMVDDYTEDFLSWYDAANEEGDEVDAFPWNDDVSQWPS